MAMCAMLVAAIFSASSPYKHMSVVSSQDLRLYLPPLFVSLIPTNFMVSLGPGLCVPSLEIDGDSASRR